MIEVVVVGAGGNYMQSRAGEEEKGMDGEQGTRSKEEERKEVMQPWIYAIRKL